MKKVLSSIFALSLLTACAGPKFTSMDLDVETAKMTARQQCYAARQAAETERLRIVATLPKDQQALVMMGEFMSRQTEAFSGKDPCATGMDINEARVKIAESQNRAAEGIVGSVIRGTVIGTGIIAGADVLKTFVRNSGTQTTTNITGDGNSTNHEHTQVTSNVENNIKTGDEAGGDVNVTNPNVSGPDQSQNEITNEAAEPAATPVAEETTSEETSSTEE